MKSHPRCLYTSDFISFLFKDINSIFGTLCDNYHGDAPTTSREAWKSEIEIMRSLLIKLNDRNGQIIFEYDIPRLGKRIDVVLLYRGIVFCLEFKVGESRILEADIDQVLDYALDLKKFHKFSKNKVIVPVLIATKFLEHTTDIQMSVYDDRVVNPLVSGERGILELITKVIERFPEESPIDNNWVISPYAPTPTIIEAAKTLYESHSVENITRHEADKVSTDETIAYIIDVIQKSKSNSEKSICFVTGVPGAGKTLVGLDVAVRQTYQGNDEPVEDEGAVYLSGNGPLVAVLNEALAQDNYKKSKGKKLTDSRREVGKFIQIIHRYRDNMLAKIKNPVENGVLEIDPEKAIKQAESGYGEVEHVAIFDEAQRAWTHKRIADYLKRGGTYGNKLKVPNFPMSEAAFLIWSLDQREDWATIVCLVGGGQEINTGEAGISEWINALNDKFPHWKVYISPKLTEAEYAEGKVNELLRENKNVTYSDSLHLGVSLRSFRAEKLSAFVHALLDINPDRATELYKEIKDKYPIVLTRDMEKARRWLHIEVSRTDLIAGYQGQTALKVKKVIEQAKGGVLFIDEAYSITENDHSDSYGRECLTELTKALEDYRDDLVVIVAGYSEPMNHFFSSNPGLKSRFNTFIEFPDYSANELFEMFEKLCSSNDYNISEATKKLILYELEACVAEKKENFANGRLVRNIYEKLIMNHARRVSLLADPTREQLSNIIEEDFKRV